MTSLKVSFDYEAVLIRCAEGERKALRELYDQESPRLLAVVLRIVRNKSLAEDIVHDAFIKIWSNATSYNPELGSARGWIYTVTRNLALSGIKYSNRSIGIDQDLLIDLIDSQSIENNSDANNCSGFTTFSQTEDAKKLDHCLEDLPPESKLCILHAYVNGYTQDEISKLLEKPLGTVKSWIKRSLSKLKECLQ